MTMASWFRALPEFSGKLQQLPSWSWIRPWKQEDRSYFQAQFDYGKKLFSGKSRDHMLAQAVISALNFAPFEEAQELTDGFNELASDPLYRDLVTGEYKTVLKTAPGNPAPDFTLTDINGEEVSLSDFQGKVVYLDFWASWCGPCMREVPFAKELKKRMAGQDDLVFLYISIDTDEEAWRRTVARPGNPGCAPERTRWQGRSSFLVQCEGCADFLYHREGREHL
jgi:thiol-disulfide isomerase/thioredoxin